MSITLFFVYALLASIGVGCAFFAFILLRYNITVKLEEDNRCPWCLSEYGIDHRG